MAYQPEQPNYDTGVYQIETTDPVDGGVGSITNSPLLNLANRTTYLYQHVNNLENGTTIPPGIATLNSPAFTGTPTAPTAPAGDNSTKLANTAWTQGLVNGFSTINCAGNSNVVLTAAQAGVGVLELTGALTGSISVIVPASSGRWVVSNRTTGAYQVTVKTAAGTGIAVTQGANTILWSDTVNVYDAKTDFPNAALTGTPTAPTPAQFDNSTKVSTTAFINEAGFHFPDSILQVTGPGTIPLSAFNGFINITAGGNYTLNLPSVASAQIGSTLSFISSNPGTVMLGLNGADGYGNLPGTTLTIQSGTLLTLIAAGGNTWWVIGGGQVMKILPEFASNFNANGYQKLPSGLIYQWGNAVGSGSTAPNATVIYPIAFPNATLQAYGNPTGTAAGTYTVLVGNPTKTQASFTASGGGTPGSVSFSWFAIGY